MDVPRGTKFIMDVIDDLKDLEVLKMYQFDGSIELVPWGNLQKLKTLEISSDSTDTTKFLLEFSAAESLERLKFRRPNIDDNFLVGLSRFTNLRVFTLVECDEFADEHVSNLDLPELTEFILVFGSKLTMNGLVEMVESFRKLTSVRLLHNFDEIDSETYDKLVGLCRKQNKKLKLKLFSFYSFLDLQEVPADINYQPDIVEVILNL